MKNASMRNRIIAGAAAVFTLCAVASPAFASNIAYHFNVSTPAFQQPAAVGQDDKTVAQHAGNIQFTSIKTGYKATAEICQTVGFVFCSGTEHTNLVVGPNYSIPNGLGVGTHAFFRIRTNTITTESIPMQGWSVTW